MSLLITDSGLGGLSMLANLVLELESKMIGETGSEMKMVYMILWLEVYQFPLLSFITFYVQF